jgi:hypothetical protein
MNDVSIGVVSGKRLPELLQGPVRCGMGSDVAVHDSACSDLHDEKYARTRNVAVTTRKKSQATMPFV